MGKHIESLACLKKILGIFCSLGTNEKKVIFSHNHFGKYKDLPIVTLDYVSMQCVPYTQIVNICVDSNVCDEILEVSNAPMIVPGMVSPVVT